MVFWRKKKTADAFENNKIEFGDSSSAVRSDETKSAESSNSVGSTDGTVETNPSISWWRRALSKTSDLLRTDIRDLWKSEGQIVDDEFLNQLFATLVRTDMGGTTAAKIRDSISDTYRSRRIELSDVLNVIREQVGQSL